MRHPLGEGKLLVAPPRAPPLMASPPLSGVGKNASPRACGLELSSAPAEDVPPEGSLPGGRVRAHPPPTFVG